MKKKEYKYDFTLGQEFEYSLPGIYELGEKIMRKNKRVKR